MAEAVDPGPRAEREGEGGDVVAARVVGEPVGGEQHRGARLEVVLDGRHAHLDEREGQRTVVAELPRERRAALAPRPALRVGVGHVGKPGQHPVGHGQLRARREALQHADGGARGLPPARLVAGAPLHLGLAG